MKYLLFITALIATANALKCQCSEPTCKEETCIVEAGNCYSIALGRGLSLKGVRVEAEMVFKQHGRENMAEEALERIFPQCQEIVKMYTRSSCRGNHPYLCGEKDKSLKVTIQGCQDEKKDPEFCKQGFVLLSSENDFYLGSNIACCKDKDLCNQNNIPNLNRTIPKSKLVCPSCFDLNKKMCDGKEMYCNERQKKCFNITGTITKGSAKAQDFVARGCAVENSIFKTNTSLTFGDASYKLVNVQLKEAKNGASRISSCLSFAILLPSVFVFLLDRPL